MELLKVDTLEEALEKLRIHTEGINSHKEMVPLEKSLGRILATDIISEENVPGFYRSTVDGFAVAAKDIQGAGENMPSFLRNLGQVEMGKEPGFSLDEGCCGYVATGAMIPKGADAVVMEEYCERFSNEEIGVYCSVPQGGNIVSPDEDIKKGQKVLERGRNIRPQDMGLLASIGCSRVLCYKEWSVYIISTGDELLSPDSPATRGKVRDVNTYGLLGLAAEMGFKVAGWQRVHDSTEELEKAICSCREKADVVVVSGGSSKGNKDITSEVINKLSTGGVFTHGIAIKPGKPTILAVDDNHKNIMIGLPGHPVAALIVFRQLIGGLWREKTQQKGEAYTMATMDINLPASPGRKTFQLVKLFQDEEGNRAVPVFGKSGIIYSMSQADGYVIMDRNQEGLRKGQRVKVYFI